MNAVKGRGRDIAPEYRGVFVYHGIPAVALRGVPPPRV